MTSWSDVASGRVEAVKLGPYVWEGGYRPYRVKTAVFCAACKHAVGARELAWYVDMIGPYCTACRNIAIGSGDKQGDA